MVEVVPKKFGGEETDPSKDQNIQRDLIDRLDSTEADKNDFLKKLARGETAQIHDILDNVEGPITEKENDPERPTEIYKEVGKSNTATRSFVEYLLQENKPEPEHIAELIKENPNPQFFEELYESRLKQLREDNNWELYNRFKYEADIQGLMHSLYGKQMEYFEEFKNLQKEAQEKFPGETKQSRIEKIEKEDDPENLKEILMEEYVNILEEFEEQGGKLHERTMRNKKYQDFLMNHEMYENMKKRFKELRKEGKYSGPLTPMFLKVHRDALQDSIYKRQHQNPKTRHEEIREVKEQERRLQEELGKIDYNLEKQPEVTKKAFETFKSEFCKIAEIKGQNLILSKLMSEGEDKYKKVLALVQDQENPEKWNTRIFRISGSDYQFKALPGYRDFEKAYMKGQEDHPRHHYVQSAKLHKELYKILETLPKSDSDILLPKAADGKREVQERHKELIEDENVSDEWNWGKFQRYCMNLYKKYMHRDESINYEEEFQKFPKSMIPNFATTLPVDSYRKTTKCKDGSETEINIEEYEVKNSKTGEKLVFAMASDQEGRVYIDNVYDPDANMDGFGMHEPIINMGHLVYKPEDYKKQIVHIPEKYVIDKGKYSDINKLWRENIPIIKEYKKLLEERGEI